jgi:hypothetical protein
MRLSGHADHKCGHPGTLICFPGLPNTRGFTAGRFSPDAPTRLRVNVQPTLDLRILADRHECAAKNPVPPQMRVQLH